MTDNTTDTKPADETKRLRIIEAAADLFADQPFHKVLLSDVATAAGVGKGTVYLYFESKEELFFSVLLQGIDRLLERLEGITAQDAPADARLRTMVQEMIAQILGPSSCARMLRNTVVGFPQDGELSDKRTALRRLMADMVQQGIDAGLFRPQNTDLAAQFILGTIRSVRQMDQKISNINEICEQAGEFILNALAAAPDAS